MWKISVRLIHHVRLITSRWLMACSFKQRNRVSLHVNEIKSWNTSDVKCGCGPTHLNQHTQSNKSSFHQVLTWNWSENSSFDITLFDLQLFQLQWPFLSSPPATRHIIKLHIYVFLFYLLKHETELWFVFSLSDSSQHEKTDTYWLKMDWFILICFSFPTF